MNLSTNESKAWILSGDVPTLHVRVRVVGGGAVLVVWSLHMLAGMAAVAPTVMWQRSPIIEESDVGHLVRHPVLVVPGDPSTIAGDGIGSSVE